MLELGEAVAEQFGRVIVGGLERCAHHAILHVHADLQGAQFRRIEANVHRSTVRQKLAAGIPVTIWPYWFASAKRTSGGAPAERRSPGDTPDAPARRPPRVRLGPWVGQIDRGNLIG